MIVFEKETYPFHKVCGEYISMESWDFLRMLGVPLETMNLPVIKQLLVSGEKGKSLRQALPLGGFGISRFVLDNMLAQLARKAGVTVEENTKVNDVQFDGKEFTITTYLNNYQARLACGSFGKRSNLDIKWKRPFTMAPKNKLNNYIGIKYHVRADFPSDTIALHLFPNGYCGIVKIEDEKYNLCYLTTAANLQKTGGDIGEMEKSILGCNPFLKELFAGTEKLKSIPETISQISFDAKTQVEDHLLMIGDAAGMITPLCGNGMSMALHGSKIAAGLIQPFLNNQITRSEMENQYSRQWKQRFGGRLRMGRNIQRLFGNRWLTDLFITTGKVFPGLISQMVKQTHGRPF